MKNNFYVYLLLDQRKHGKYVYKKYEFDFCPFYVGKGKNKRTKRSYFHFRSAYKTNKTSFNHTGPCQSDSFVLSSFAKQLAEIKLNKKENVIDVGNLKACRDFTDVRDVVRAYELVSDSYENGTAYNVCSGKHYEIAGLLDRLIRIANVDVNIRIDPSRLRTLDCPYYYGSYKKIKTRYNWEPRITIDRTLRDLYRWWLKKLSK